MKDEPHECGPRDPVDHLPATGDENTQGDDERAAIEETGCQKEPSTR
jgi:hypothetical protein